MKLGLQIFGLALFGSITAASAQSSLTITQGTPAQPGHAAVKNIPFVNDGLYLVTLKCNPYVLDENNSANRYYPGNPFVDETRQLAFTITLSNARIATNGVPVPSSVLTAVPVVADNLSRNAPVLTKNNTCNQSLLATGRTPLYLTAVYTDQISDKPSQLITAFEAIAGIVAPLAGFFSTGVGNLLKADTTAVSSMATPYANLVGTLNYASSQTDTEPLEQGSYVVATPVGKVAISVDKLTSLQAALAIPEVAGALDTSWQSLGSQVQSKIGTDANVCYEIGRTLELNQNLSHEDAVHALAKIVNYSLINSGQATNCLGTYFGPEVAVDLRTSSPGLHLGPVFPNLQNAVSYAQVQLVFAQIASAMSGYTAGTDTKAVLDNWFESPVVITDTAPQIFTGTTSLTVEQILDKMKGASPQYVFYGCQEKDSGADASNVQDVGFFLAIGKDRKPGDVLIMRTWWRYSDHPRIYQIYLGYDPAVSQALTDYKNVCAYHVVVGTPPSAPQALESLASQPTPANLLAILPVQAIK